MGAPSSVSVRASTTTLGIDVLSRAPRKARFQFVGSTIAIPSCTLLGDDLRAGLFSIQSVGNEIWAVACRSEPRIHCAFPYGYSPLEIHANAHNPRVCSAKYLPARVAARLVFETRYAGVPRSPSCFFSPATASCSKDHYGL